MLGHPGAHRASSSYAAPSSTSLAESSRLSIASSLNVIGPSQSISSPLSDRWTCSIASATSRLVSVFSIRSRHSPAAAPREEGHEEKGTTRCGGACQARGRMRTRTLIGAPSYSGTGRFWALCLWGADATHRRGIDFVDLTDDRDRERPHKVGCTLDRVSNGQPRRRHSERIRTERAEGVVELLDCACRALALEAREPEREVHRDTPHRRGTTPPPSAHTARTGQDRGAEGATARRRTDASSGRLGR